MPAPAVKILTSVFDVASAKNTGLSYTLQNTPFYFTPVWSNDTSRGQFSQYQIYWDFGDSTNYVGPSATHYYQSPGVYNVTATFYDLVGNPWTVNQNTDSVIIQLTAINAVPDLISFSNLIPSNQQGVYFLPAGQRSIPLEINRYNSWQADKYLPDNQYTINLYASGSTSDYLSPRDYYSNKWSHLKAYHTFVEISVNEGGVIDSQIVESTKTTSVSVYAEKYQIPFSWDVQLRFYNYPATNTSFAGTTGTTSNGTSVHYMDQKPSKVVSDSIVFLYASPDTRSYLDTFNIENKLYPSLQYPVYGYFNTAWSVQYLKSIFNAAASLDITSNGITTEGQADVLGVLSAQQLHSFDIYPVKWTNAKIPFVLTLKDQNNFSTKCYPPITAFKFDGTDPTEINSASIELYKYVDLDIFSPWQSTSSVRVDDAIFSQNLNVPVYLNSGSYFAGNLIIPTETKLAVICASVLIQDEPALNLGTTVGFAGQPGQKTITRFSRRPIFSNCDNVEMTLTYTQNTQTYATTQSASVPVSVSPLKSYFKGIQDRVWVADSDNDFVYMYDISGTLLQEFDLSNMPFFNGQNTAPVYIDLRGSLNSCSPANIAIDESGHAWVSLYDSITSIKIDSNLLVVTASAVPNLQNIEYLNHAYYRTLKNELSGFVGENSLLPSALDTDVDSNIWISYSHPVSGFLIKYSSAGALLSAIPVPSTHSIQEVLVDRDNNVWAAAINLKDIYVDTANKVDAVYKWNKEYNLVDGFPVYVNGAIGGITIDTYQNLWCSTGLTNVTRIDPVGASVVYQIGQPSTFDFTRITFYQQHGGIATDTEGFLWILHNINGKIYYFPIVPVANQIPLSSMYSGDLPNIELDNADGSQAFYNVLGDWTGSRWVNKYFKATSPAPRIVRGRSNLFDILTNGPVVNKVNENFDYTANLKSYILQESLFDKPGLLDEFIGQIAGNYESAPKTLGKTIYEKIANYVSNVADSDTCNLQALESLFKQYGIEYNDFIPSAPAQLRRALDILSINPTKLFGNYNVYSENFGLSSMQYNLGKNLGPIIDIATGTFVAGDPIVAYEKFSNNYKLIRNTAIPNQDSTIGQPYPLSGVNYYWGWGLVTGFKAQSGMEIDDYYTFYKYLPTYQGGMYDNIIDFNNELTTITPTQSSYEEWTKYGGNMDKVLSYALYEGLGLYE